MFDFAGVLLFGSHDPLTVLRSPKILCDVIASHGFLQLEMQ